MQNHRKSVMTRITHVKIVVRIESILPLMLVQMLVHKSLDLVLATNSDQTEKNVNINQFISKDNLSKIK